MANQNPHYSPATLSTVSPCLIRNRRMTFVKSNAEKRKLDMIECFELHSADDTFRHMSLRYVEVSGEFRLFETFKPLAIASIQSVEQ